MSYRCDACNRRFNTWRACKQHIDALDHWRWEYETCTAIFDDSWQAEEHMDLEDHWSYPFKCETCTRIFRTEDDRDGHQEDEGHYAHLHCTNCNRYFQSEHHLKQHLNSRIHRGATISCPFCATGFATASGVSHHLETSSCPKARNLDRQAIHQAIRQRDTKGVVTKRLLEWDENDGHVRWDPASAWNGCGYDCYLCGKVFNAPQSLRQHITSPVHQ